MPTSMRVQTSMRAFLVDDEPLALKRLARLLKAAPQVEVIGAATDPVEAVQALSTDPVDLLFLDIEMPGMTGFEMLSRLDPQPLVIFTTAYDRYALQAFEVNSVAYLLKPIEAEQLERALKKIERIRRGGESRPDLQRILDRITALENREQYPEKIASRVGDKVEFIELSRVTHFYAKDKLTYAAGPSKDHVIDLTIAELEQKLDPKKFIRIHRATILNLAYVRELHTWFAGRMMVRLKGERAAELTVARDRARALKERLGVG